MSTAPDLTNPDVVIDVLTRAIERLRDSWGKGQLIPGLSDETPLRTVNPDTCKVCAVGALSWALCGHPYPNFGSRDLGRDVWGEIDTLTGIIMEANGARRLGGWSITGFNDDPLTLEEDVIDVLRTAYRYVKDLDRLPIDTPASRV